MKRVTPMLLLSASLAVGCAQIQDSRFEARTRRMARAAYVNSPGACNGVVHSVDYSQGFEEGYYDVASGGDGCPPALPPKKYWRATYQTPAGREHIEAWFQGFRDGAAAAKADGAAAYGTIYVSEEHRNGMRRAAEMEHASKRPLVPQPATHTPLPPAPGMQPVEILGPSPVVPPNSTPARPPMSDATKTPPLRNVQPPPPLVPSPSAQRPERNGPDAKSLAPMAASPLMPPDLLAPPSAPAAAIKQVEATLPTAAPEPVKLKLPEFELPPGFAPDASLGDPKAVGDR